MKKLRFIYPYGLNERAKKSNLEQATGKLFPSLPRFSNRRENLEKRRVNEPTKFDTTDTLLAHIAKFPPKNRSGNFCKILEGMKRKDLRKLASNATDELKTCDDTKKRWCELIIYIFLTKFFTTDKRVQKKRPPFAILVFFHNKGFDYMNLSSILHLDIVKNIIPNDKLKIDEPPYVVYSLGKTIRNNILNHKDTVSSIVTNDDITYGTGIVKRDCQQHKDFVDKNHSHV